MSKYHVYITKTGGVTVAHGTALQVEASATVGDSELLLTTEETAKDAAALGVTAADIAQCSWVVCVHGAEHGFVAFGSSPNAASEVDNGTVTTARKGVNAGTTRYFAVANLTDKVDVIDEA